MLTDKQVKTAKGRPESAEPRHPDGCWRAREG